MKPNAAIAKAVLRPNGPISKLANGDLSLDFHWEKSAPGTSAIVLCLPSSLFSPQNFQSRNRTKHKQANPQWR